MHCPDDVRLAAHLDGAGGDPEVDAHLDRCADCRAIVAELGRGASVGAVPASETLQPGDRVGRYVLVGHLGAGAAGTVYAAFDPELDRRIAIKVMHELVDAASLARWRQEAQSLAHISHPNVVRVYDVGQHEGAAPFIAMEHLDGGTLREWAATPRSWREVLEVYLAAGEGLVAAHAQGIVHRDFKPDNVLRTTDGRVCVGDFGLARDAATPDVDDGADDRTGIAGTPAYMAPEQREGRRADARSDQFALCVALHEALTGGRPGEPVEARAGAAAPRRVMAVVRRGLAADAEARYPSVSELLAALRRASRSPFRNAPWLALVGVGVAAVASWPRMEPCGDGRDYLGQFWNDEQRAELDLIASGSTLPYAAEAGRATHAAIDEWVERWAAAHREACEVTRRGEQSGERLDRRVACLRGQADELGALVSAMASAGEAGLESAVAVTGQLPAARACDDPPPADTEPSDAAATRGRLARVRANAMLGQVDDAREELGTLEASLDDESRRWFAADVSQLRARIADQQGDYPEAVRLLESALSEATLAGRSDLLVEIFVALMRAEGIRGDRPDRGERWAAIAEPLLADDVQRVNFLRWRAVLLERGSKLDESIAAHREALELIRIVYGETSTHEADALSDLGGVLIHASRLDEAEPVLMQALEIFEASYGPAHPQLSHALDKLGLVQSRRGDYGPALDRLREALAIREAVYGAEHPFVGRSLSNIGMTLRRARRYEEARETLQRAVVIAERTSGFDSLQRAMALGNLANTVGSMGDLEEALRLSRLVMEIREAKLGPEARVTMDARHNVCVALISLGRADEAIPLARANLVAAEAMYGRDTVVYADRESMLGWALLDSDPEIAADHLERALRVKEEAGASPNSIAATRERLVAAREAAGGRVDP